MGTVDMLLIRLEALKNCCKRDGFYQLSDAQLADQLMLSAAVEVVVKAYEYAFSL
jgi:hypothetical protein